MEDRDVSHLCPALQRLVSPFLDRCALLAPDNEVIKITTTYRNAATQTACERLGLSNAKAGNSPHNCLDGNGAPFAKAFDFTVFRDGKIVSNGRDPAYTRCGTIGEDFGLKWGGRFKRWINGELKPFVDAGHLELPNWRANEGK